MSRRSSERRRIETEETHGAIVRGEHGREHPQQRRLAGTVRAEQPDDAAGDVEVDIVDSPCRTEALDDTVDGDVGGMSFTASSSSPRCRVAARARPRQRWQRS